jgi:hypothetical protein
LTTIRHFVPCCSRKRLSDLAGAGIMTPAYPSAYPIRTPEHVDYAYLFEMICARSPSEEPPLSSTKFRFSALIGSYKEM